MCKPTDVKETKSNKASTASATTASASNKPNNAVQNIITPTHTSKRNTSSDWIIFCFPLLFGGVTNVAPIYITAVARIVITHVILSLHWMFVDKDNYHAKLPQTQLQRERGDYMTATLMHMVTQTGLQIVFPSMFFVNASHISTCAWQVFFLHCVVVEPAYYIVHRWLHVPKQMKAMHGFHHLSINTLPTTSLVQNFWEHGVYVATFGPAFFLPYLVFGKMHWTVIGGYLIAFDVVNAWGHTNVRVRNWFLTKTPLKYVFYTPEFHLGHHKYFTANYALFMPIWDLLGGSYREYTMPDLPTLPAGQQDVCFIGHNGGLGHLFTTPEWNYYNVYDDYYKTFLPLSLEILVMHWICQVYRMTVNKFYYCSRFCIGKEFIGRIIVLTRSPYDYMKPARYTGVNQELIQCMKMQHKKFGTRKFGLGNLNKMKQLNDGGQEIVKLIQADEYLKDKKICIWTGDTMTVASVFHQIADIPHLESVYYVGAGGKVGTAVCELLVKTMPHLKLRIFSRNHVLHHANISYSSDLAEIQNYKVAVVGKILSGKMWSKAFKVDSGFKTRFVLDYTVPAFPIAALEERKIKHIRIGLLHTKQQNNPFLQGHYDFCMSHPENHIVPCHFGCLLNTAAGRETHEVGEIDQDDVERLWKMGTARGFHNVAIDYSEQIEI